LVKVNSKEPWKLASSTQAAKEDKTRYFPYNWLGNSSRITSNM